MGTGKLIQLFSVEEYLAAEADSPVKHEFLGGVILAMGGGSNRHNTVASNVLISLGGRLRTSPCQPFNSDTMIRIRLPGHTRFYYPDVSIVCRQNAPQEVFQDDPVVVVEVLSDSTRRVDLGEKQEAYLSIPALSVYLLIETDTAAVVAFRRGPKGFVREVWEGLRAVVPLPEIGAELPLEEVYLRLEI